MMMGALTYVAFIPDNTWNLIFGAGVERSLSGFLTAAWNDLLSPFTALPIQAFNWTSRPQPEFHMNAAGAITILLLILLSMNAVAIWLRLRFQRRFK